MTADKYYLSRDVSGENWAGDLELVPGTAKSQYKRVRGFINLIRQNNRKSVKVTYYAGCTMGPPPEVVNAIASLAKVLISNDGGDMQSESYDYYNYSRLSADELRMLPTSAVAILLSYRQAF